MDFSAFDKQINLDQLKKDTEEIKKNGGTGDFPEIPAGNYNAKVEKLELGATKDGRPMLRAMFRITEGDLHNIVRNTLRKVLREDTWQDQMHDAVANGGDIDSAFDRLKNEIPDSKERIRALNKYYAGANKRWRDEHKGLDDGLDDEQMSREDELEAKLRDYWRRQEDPNYGIDEPDMSDEEMDSLDDNFYDDDDEFDTGYNDSDDSFDIDGVDFDDDARRQAMMDMDD